MKRYSTLLFLISLFFAATNAQDWPNLGRYAAANHELLNQPKTGLRVVMMGNSITEGWLNTSPEFFKKHPSLVDRGISGQTTPQMLLRFRADVVALKADVVVILAGTNDIAGNTGESTLEMITNNIASMCEIARANNIKVILSALVPASSYYWKPELKPAPRIIELNRWIKAYAAKNGFGFIDYHTPMSDKEGGLPLEYSGDGVHPNQKGYQVMEPLFEQALLKVLTKKQATQW